MEHDRLHQNARLVESPYSKDKEAKWRIKIPLNLKDFKLDKPGKTKPFDFIDMILHARHLSAAVGPVNYPMFE